MLNLKKEMKFVLLNSRLTWDESVKEEVEKLIHENLEWNKIIDYSSKNKVLYLLFDNLMKSGYGEFIPKYFSSLIDDSCSCNYLRNEEKISELQNVQIEMYKNNISIAPVKGGYLIDNVYKNRKIRTTNDIDILIRRNDIRIIDEIMKSFGYKQGDYKRATNSILLPNTKKKMLYKTKMYNLLPYNKINYDIPNKTVIFDFSFALDFTLDTKPVEEMLNMAIQTENGLELLPEHFLVHMCCHHYREASNVAWILIGKDLNLIKFCDVREFILQKMDADSIAKSIRFCKKHSLEKAMYFTIYFTREIYNDGYEIDILKSLDIQDESFLYQFGEKDYNELQTRKKDFFTSLFSNNQDEITQTPKYESLIEGDI